MRYDRELVFIRDYLTTKLFPECPFPTPPAEMDWERLALLLDCHRLSAHFSVLGKPMQEHWPPAFCERIRGDRYSLMFYGDQCVIHIQALLMALDKADIPVIVLKGWAYIPRIYGGDHSQRMCEDIDILVRQQDLERVEVILRWLDFKLAMESWQGYNHRFTNGARYFVGGKSGVPGNTFSIGLHWGLWHSPAYDAELIDIDALFERAHPLEVATVPAFELSIEDHIVYACAHLGLHHRFEDSLFRFYELAATILKAETVDWGKVITQANSWRVILPAKYVLGRTKALRDEVIPAWVLESLDTLKPTQMELFTERWIVATRGRPAFAHLLTWLTFPNWKQRFLIMLQDVFPNPTYMVHRYGEAPGGVWLLLYFRRFFYALGFLFR